jgi:hypothetical protein
MTPKTPKDYCYLARNSKSCIKLKISKKYLPYYECALCIWRIRSETTQHIKNLKKLYERYHNFS